MREGRCGEAVELRGFRWKLQPVERKLDAEVEGARLALALLQQQSRGLQQAEDRRGARQRQQESLALQEARRDVIAGAHAVRYLARLEAERIAAEAARAELEQRVVAARAACAARQRQLESVQALRRAAQQEHAQERLRREWRDADAAWLALAQLRRAAQRRDDRKAP